MAKLLLLFCFIYLTTFHSKAIIYYKYKNLKRDMEMEHILYCSRPTAKTSNLTLCVSRILQNYVHIIVEAANRLLIITCNI